MTAVRFIALALAGALVCGGLVSLACGDCDDVDREPAEVQGFLGAPGGGTRSWGTPGRTGPWSTPGRAPPLFNVVFSPTASVVNALQCTTANNCQAVFYADGAGGGSGQDASGASVAVTDGTGGVAQATPWGAGTYVPSNAAAMSVTTSSAFENTWTAPHTVIMVGYQGGAATYGSMFSHITPSTAGIFAETWTTAAECYWANGASTIYNTTAVNYGQKAGLSVSSCRKIGSGAGSTYQVRSNGQQPAAGALAANPAAPTGQTFYLGRSTGTSGTFLDGPFIALAVYTTNLSDAKILEIENRVSGSLADDGTPLTTVTSTRQRWDFDASGDAWPYGNIRVTPRGLHIEKNNDGSQGVCTSGGCWAADALDASSWTNVGTPTVTTNVASGPFAKWRNTAEADRIVDDDGVAFEGKEATTNCYVSASSKLYTISALLKQGDSGVTTTQARLEFTSDGTLSVAGCNFTDLGATFARKECTTSLTGAPTFLRGRVLVGDAAADTGSVIVSQAQCDASGWATSPKPDNVARSADLYRVPSTETTTWPRGFTADSGECEVVFTPDFDFPGDAADSNDPIRLLDVPNAGNTEHRIICGVFDKVSYPNGLARIDASGAVGPDVTGGAAATFTAGTQYVFRFQWVNQSPTTTYQYMYWDACTDAYSCTATTLKGSNTAGTGKVAPADFGEATIGYRYTGTGQGGVSIKRITVRRL